MVLNENDMKQRDHDDPLKELRKEFLIPTDSKSQPIRYFCGHSLGLQPKNTSDEINNVLEGWGNKGVEQWFDRDEPWYTYFDKLREPLAKFVGAATAEVTVMNSLTVNMHLLFTSFYRPHSKRYKIIVDGPVFPSDLFVIKSQIRLHGFDPETSLIVLEPQGGGHILSDEDIQECLRNHGPTTALVWFSGVNYFTGQYFNLQNLTQTAQSYGCKVGLDLAHAIGNVPLNLHEWGVDFAVWCHYKYFNSGPGSVGGAFVHDKHVNQNMEQRLEGWWGCDPNSRFDMQETKGFIPAEGANAWQLSTPSILSAAPLKASLDLFEKVPVSELRKKSVQMTDLLQQLLLPVIKNKAEIISPKNSGERGAQLSLLLHGDPGGLLDYLFDKGIVCDFRKPNVLRAAPVPLYNTYQDIFVLAKAISDYFS